MWTYVQNSGALLDPTGKLLATGYSGAGVDKNVPADANVENMGPLPCGFYTIGPPENTIEHGPYVLTLTPDPANQEFGRGGFLMHGDSIQHPGCASKGCIVMPHVTRVTVWESGDTRLEVVSGL